jgi:stringent starvation protein B
MGNFFGSDSSKKETIQSTKPYLIRALFDWCVDNSYTPYISIFVDQNVQVPFEFVKNNEIVLNLAPSACKDLELGNEYISFKARFSGVARDIMLPVTHVMAIYSKENSQGMSFPVNIPTDTPPGNSNKSSSEQKEAPKTKSHLKLVK